MDRARERREARGRRAALERRAGRGARAMGRAAPGADVRARRRRVGASRERRARIRRDRARCAGARGALPRARALILRLTRPHRGDPDPRRRDMRTRSGGSRARWLLAVAGLLLASCADAPPPSVILISLDTVRADRLGVYGYE